MELVAALCYTIPMSILLIMIAYFSPADPVYARVYCDKPYVTYRLDDDGRRYAVSFSGFLLPSKSPDGQYSTPGCLLT
jgi:hypothetical protein